MKEDWTMKQALLCLVGSTCLTLAVSFIGYSFWKKYRNERLYSESHRITAIIQTGPEKEALKTAYLAELLSLSADRPTQLYAFDPKKGESLLLASPIIAKASVKRLPPSSLYIDYEVRKPVGWLADYKNTAIDREGYIFPVAPFLSPKRLPEIYLGGVKEEGSWKIKHPSFQLALEILDFFESAPWKEGLRIQRIDVSNALAPSLGLREVVLFTEEELTVKKEGEEIVCIFPKILRLAPKDYQQQLNNFLVLRRTMMADYMKQISSIREGGKFSPRIIDLRIPQLAFVEKG